MDVQVKVVMPERSLNSMSLTCGLVFRRGRTQLVVVALELLLLGQDDLRRLEGFDGRAVQALGLANQLQLDSRPRVEGEGYLPGGGSV